MALPRSVYPRGIHRSILGLIIALVMLLTSMVSASDSRADGFSPFQKTVPELVAALNDGRISSTELVQWYLRRIRAFDDTGPGVNAILRVNPRALDQARAIDRARARGDEVGPLAGVPFLVKDNINVQGLPTTGGSVALRNAMPRDDAFLIKRLRRAGAIVLAKANMTEFAASFGQPGYSSLGGTTRNPYNPDRYASGSSSGPAAGVAANLAAFAVGTDTEGSVRGPASVTGLVGLRPTYGLISRSGILPLSPTFDTPGPLTRSVSGSALITRVMAGTDSDDDATERLTASMLKTLGKVGPATLEGLKVGRVTGLDGGNAQIDDAMTPLVASLEQGGAVVSPVQLPRAFDRLWSRVIAPVQNAEFRPAMERFLGNSVTGAPPNMNDIIARCEENNRHNPHQQVNPERIEGMEHTLGRRDTVSPDYLDTLSYTLPKLRERLVALMDEQHLDVLIFPTRECPAHPRTPSGKAGFTCTRVDHDPIGYLATVTGAPELTLPLGMTEAGMPFGVSLLARPFEENTLFALGQALFKQSPAPRYTPELAPGWYQRLSLP
ncbi:amidase [Larsenimonas suaedae]|uniref:Amidase n=1 Tax=Larsenimonas suaedae TaxID=1851019 RepID=A0ABU1GTZ7_9GAMM|nr:amidase [Larsenimonas suaedae]MCM2972139.1 amidase [Larsenimonas suaedae]MDR5895067.1 amidase [Larsenimonas suaedae]